MNLYILKEKQENITLEELYKKFSSDIFKYSFSILKDYEEAKDTVQEVFMKYAESETIYKKNCSPKTWLLIITRNYCFNKLKNKNFNLLKIEDQILSDYTTPNYDEKISIEHAIKKLPSEYSELIFLRDFEGYSYKEIAEIAEISLENVKIKLFRARQQLRKFLRNEI